MTRTNVLKILFLTGLAGSVCQLQASDALACNLKALTQAERARHQQLGHAWHAAVADRREFGDGYAFRIDPSKISIVELAEWIGYEQKCCPFFRFRLDVDEARSVWMTLSGRPGVKQFIAAEFPAE